MMSQTLLLSDNSKQQPIWSQLHGCSLALALAEFCSSTPGVKLVITPDTLTANQLFAELQFFLNNNTNEILFFPDWETLPYDQFSPYQDIISTRLTTLSRLPTTTNAILLTAASTIMHRLCPPTFLHQFALVLEEKQSLDLQSFREQLTRAGYRCVNKVLEHGEFAIRGGIIDLYPMGNETPFRIELFDDSIESLRCFDPDTQRTIKQINAIHILPAREFPSNEKGIAEFRRAFRETFSGNPGICPIYEGVTQGQYPAGIEYYLPLFFTETATLFDYLPEKTRVCLINNVQQQAEAFFQEVTLRYEQRNQDVTRPLLPPTASFLSANTLMETANQHNPIRFYSSAIEKKHGVCAFSIAMGEQFSIERQSADPLSHLRNAIEAASDWRHVFIVESAGRREVLLSLLKQSNITPTLYENWSSFLQDDAPIGMLIGPITEGAQLANARISLVVESQLFGEQAVPQRRQTQKNLDPDLIVRNLAELQIGAPVVHIDYGVGRYQGLKTLEHDGTCNEFLILTYANDDKIYVPVTNLTLISRYTGTDPDHAPLHRLGSEQWQKEKKKAAEKIHDVAIELLDIYAKREAKQGYRYTVHEDEYERFVSRFPFEETIDQRTVINAIIADMQSSRPMDRLICGDVGFGKTEVAMRAAFLAVQNGKQVCVLAPTTLLAGQHHTTFCDRFADFPITIELLSRFRTTKDSEKVITSLKNGRTDIIIGTHKLLQKHIEFQQLGLLIIDEEHRFGVKQKEYIKGMRSDVDILSMTATPIPRTLNMAMHGIRDISLITTPPAKRLAIKTFWQEKNNFILREAVLREILRGGQVFFLHNVVETIDRVAQDIKTLVPEAKVRSAHGQMRERDLERIMSDFYHHHFNVLVCTTIIETGIDIPTANTIIIDKANTFGLAQLHQLRGRVGRSHHQAYAYLLTPNEEVLTKDAVKRLEAIVSLEDLGAGFTLATHDLEIRGAGELLGAEQSGNIHAIGFNLFMEMLDQAVDDLRSGKKPMMEAPLHTGPEIELRISAIIPEDYIGDVHMRLTFYKRIAHANSVEALHDLQVELIDRFGLLPLPLQHLFLITQLKQLASMSGVARITGVKSQITIEFTENPRINPEALIHLIQTESQRYQLDGPKRLRIILAAETSKERIHEIDALLRKLAK